MSSKITSQIQYALLPIIMVACIFAAAAGGLWMLLVLLLPALMATFVDEFAGDQGEDGSYHAALLNFYLLSCLPCIALLSVVFGYYAGVGFLSGSIEAAFATLGIDIAANKAATTTFEFTVGILGAGMLLGAGATNVAHELTHRSNVRDFVVGRWLLAFTLDTTFAIEHVHGHHRHVGTKQDPATARRGEYVLGFVFRSSIGAFLGAFEIEAERAQKRGYSAWSLKNRAIRGQFMTLALIAVHYFIAGWMGVLFFVIIGLIGKLFLELVNYVEHYGLIRLHGTRVEPRHSWNCNRFVSNMMLFNLPWHSHHHQFANKPFWQLENLDGTPTMPHGYLTMLIIALVPPLWNAKVEPMLHYWEQELATDDEREVMQAERLELGWAA
ncbi:MAG: alkane 1-monooxygenase [Hyphomicrobiales bacterium]